MKSLLLAIAFTFTAVWAFAQHDFDNQGVLFANGGNVGVATSNPQEPLHVNGNMILPNSKFYLSFRSDGIDKQQVFGLDSNNDVIFNRSAITQQKKSGLIFGSAERFIDFRNGSNTTLMRIEALTGKVGIGTVNTGSFQLAVEGSIGCREVRVTDANPFPDYVFSTDYNLRSLEEVEKFIKQEGHLPNIPSAQEIEEIGGVDLGKMNNKLLEKVEELTLYLIQQNKKIKQLEEKIAEMEKASLKE